MGLARWPRHESRIDQTYHSLERPSGDAIGIIHYLWNAVRRTGYNGVINVAVAVYESRCTCSLPALWRGIRQFRRDHPDPPAALPGHRDAPDVESNLRGRLRPAGRSPAPDRPRFSRRVARRNRNPLPSVRELSRKVLVGACFITLDGSS